jgi:hypothetical protein
MAQPAPVRTDITPTQIITITSSNGQLSPSQDPTTIPNGGSVQFVNNANEPIVIEFFTKENDHHIAISLYLPATAGSNSAIMCNDPQHSDSRCYYSLVAYDDASGPSITDNTSGSHSIVIGTTQPDSQLE